MVRSVARACIVADYELTYKELPDFDPDQELVVLALFGELVGGVDVDVEVVEGVALASFDAAEGLHGSVCSAAAECDGSDADGFHVFYE